MNLLSRIINWFDGKKTYFTALAALAYAIGGYFSGALDQTRAVELILAAFGMSGIRSAIAKI